MSGKWTLGRQFIFESGEVLAFSLKGWVIFPVLIMNWDIPCLPWHHHLAFPGDQENGALPNSSLDKRKQAGNCTGGLIFISYLPSHFSLVLPAYSMGSGPCSHLGWVPWAMGRPGESHLCETGSYKSQHAFFQVNSAPKQSAGEGIGL